MKKNLREIEIGSKIKVLNVPSGIRSTKSPTYVVTDIKENYKYVKRLSNNSFEDAKGTLIKYDIELESGQTLSGGFIMEDMIYHIKLV